MDWDEISRKVEEAVCSLWSGLYPQDSEQREPNGMDYYRRLEDESARLFGTGRIEQPVHWILMECGMYYDIRQDRSFVYREGDLDLGKVRGLIEFYKRTIVSVLDQPQV